eukprot:TRINITY_DN11484_c0_g1_i3.p1 TRINITY_DN11484_c0_g1~~TRINITY_DN11484_c0_g1_i3.p1  ORF type:complete len:262 (-),score=68.50 TRINITY_DN11484_c0_g1_i3:372-1076(-)
MLRSLVGSEMCIRDSINAEYGAISSLRFFPSSWRPSSDCGAVMVLERLHAPVLSVFQLWFTPTDTSATLLDASLSPTELGLPQFGLIEIHPAPQPDPPSPEKSPTIAAAMGLRLKIPERTLHKHIVMAGRSFQASVRGEAAADAIRLAHKHNLWADGEGVEAVGKMMCMVSDARELVNCTLRIGELRMQPDGPSTVKIAALTRQKQEAAKRIMDTLVRFVLASHLLPVSAKDPG